MIGLPAYNESQAIANLLDRINEMRSTYEGEMEVLVVNDGSKDDTEDYLKEYSLKYPHISYINHPGNKGLAQGMRTIIEHATKNLGSQDILIVLDADNTHNPSIIPPMVEKLIAKNLDIVIASRFEEGGQEIGLSLDRKILSRGAAVFAKMVFNTKGVRDYSCGFRAYRVDLLNKMIDIFGENLVEAEGFECMIEIISKAGLVGAKIGEYPLILEYNLKETPSEMKVMKTIKGYFKLGFRHGKSKRMVKKR